MEAAWEWCNWLFPASVLTLAVPSSLRLMMSKSKSLLRPSVLLRTMCPVSPSHCACGEQMQKERERKVGDSLKGRLNSVQEFQLWGRVRTLEEKWRGSRGSRKKRVLTDSWRTRWGTSGENWAMCAGCSAAPSPYALTVCARNCYQQRSHAYCYSSIYCRDIQLFKDLSLCIYVC